MADTKTPTDRFAVSPAEKAIAARLDELENGGLRDRILSPAEIRTLADQLLRELNEEAPSENRVD